MSNTNLSMHAPLHSLMLQLLHRAYFLLVALSASAHTQMQYYQVLPFHQFRPEKLQITVASGN